MNIMMIRFLIFSIVFSLSFNSLYAQGIKFGGKLSVGFGGMNNQGSIQNYYDFKVIKDEDITEFNFNYNSGTSINIGGIVAYQFNDMLSLNSGIEIQRLNNEIDINRKKITDKTDGSFKINESTTKISVTSFIIPVTVKARFGQSTFKPFIEAGLSFETRVSKNIESEELKTDFDASNNETNLTNFAFKDKPLDGLNGTVLNYIIGGGVDYDIDDKMILFFSLTYSANIGTSELWVKNLNSSSVDVGDNNRIFDSSDQATLRSEGFIIDDWKSSLLSINIGILF